MAEAGGRTPPPTRLRGISAAVAAALLLSLWGCPAPGPRLLKRYESYRPPPPDPEAGGPELVDVSAFTSSLPTGDPPPLLRELSPSAQAAYVRSLAEKTVTAAEFQRALAAPLGAHGDEEPTVDRTRFRRRLVVSVEGPGPAGAGEEGGRVPGARIAWLEITLTLSGDPGSDRPETRARHARFTDWDRFATRYDTVDLGTMESSETASAGVELGLLAGALGRSSGPAGLELGRSAGLDESVSLRERHVSNGVLRPRELVLLQEGAMGVDLSGNSVVNIELRADRPARTSVLHRFEGTFDGAGNPRLPGDLGLVNRQLVYAPPADTSAPPRLHDVTARLRWRALVRTVSRRGGGGATYSEADDRVAYRWAEGGPETVVLVPGRELRTSVWQISDPACNRIKVTRIEAGEDTEEEGGKGADPALTDLRFGSRTDALDFLRWLRATSAREGPQALRAAGRGLYLEKDRPLERSDAGDLAVVFKPLNWRPEVDYSACP